MIVIILSAIVMAPMCMLLPAILCYTHINKKVNVLVYSALLAFFLGLAGYWFIDPATDPDLVRYLSILNQYDGKNIFESFNLTYSNLFALDIYFHLISLLQNEQMLPAISVFLFYFIFFYIFADFKVRNNIKNREFTIYLLFFISSVNYCSIVNGIRWPLAFAMFFLAFYRETIQGRKNVITILLYLASVLFHFSTLVFVILRLLLFLKNRKLVVIIGASAAFSPQIIELLSNQIGGRTFSIPGMTQIVYFIQRANMYFQWEGGEWADIVRESRYYRLEAWYYYVIVAFFIFILIRLYLKKNEEKKDKKMLNKEEIFVFYLLVITIISFTMSAHTYIRFVTPLISCFFIFLFKIYEIEKGWIKTVIYYSLILFSCIGIFLNLYLLKSMMELGDYFSNIFTSGVLRVILENICGSF